MKIPVFSQRSEYFVRTHMMKEYVVSARPALPGKLQEVEGAQDISLDEITRVKNRPVRVRRCDEVQEDLK